MGRESQSRINSYKDGQNVNTLRRSLTDQIQQSELVYFSPWETNWKSTVLQQHKKEILKAVKSLKNNKASGIDNITAEVLKTGIRFATDWLYDLFHKIWNAKTISVDWCRGIGHNAQTGGE